MCPVCQDPARKVLEAYCAGTTIYLNPEPDPKGFWAVVETRGVLRARRLLTASSPMFEKEEKYAAHNCAGRLEKVA